MLDSRADVTRDEMAQFEFLFIGALDDSQHGIPNLEIQVANSPWLFVQAVALTYKRRDEGQDPPELIIENFEKRHAVAWAAHSLLDQIRKIPGADADGRIETKVLTEWLAEVRRLLREYGRDVIGDQCIGQLLAKAPADENRIWPCEAVCEAMEEIASREIGRGFVTGVRNSRGVYWKSEGGQQESELAAKYRAWAERLYFR